jgi:hypothetical protein
MKAAPGGIGGLGCAIAVPAKDTPAARTRRAAERVKCLGFLMATTLQAAGHALGFILQNISL